ncbi:MAG: AMP-binding protein, partial [Chloroflexi bacterium]|nr:AMP-binding protein [Chloroflexota bacterium]
GHSLNATQVIARLRTASGRDLPLPLIFEHPQLSALAAAIDQALPGASTLDALPLVPQPRQADQPLPLSFAQQRLWLLQQITPEDASYNIPLALELTGQLDVAALHRSLSLIVARHEVLRTSFALHGDVPVQQIAPTLTLPLPLVDLTQLPAAERSIQAAETMRMTAQHPFDLAHGPLLLAALLRFAPDQHRLLLTLHHIAADGWSTSVLVRELSAAYAAYRANAEPVLPALPIQYADYAVWQRQWMQGDVLDRLLGYWTQQLAGSPPILELPTDYSRPTTFEFHGAEHTFVIDPELTAQLHALSQREDVTLFMTLLATFNVLLSRYTGQHDLVVGSPVAGRSAPDVEPLIGFFVNMLALRTDLSGNPSFRDLLARVRETCLAAYAHQDLSFEQLVEALQPQRDLSRTPIFQVLFALQNTPHIEISLPELTATPFEVENTTAKYDLSVTLTETDGGLACTIEYRTDLFAPATIARLAAHFQTLLAAVVRDPSQQIGRLPLLSQDERHQLLAVNTAQPVAAEATLHELFEAQAARTPEAVAVVWEDQQLSYDQLNRRANQLAHYLRARGVGPEMRIGLCVERSLDLIVGLLGILKAGAAYVPLDPALPLERQRVILDDTQVALLVTQQRLAADLPEYAAQIVCLDADHAAIAQLPATNPPCVTTPDQLAYIIYTSGSTGRPKGVMIPHGNVARIYAGWEDTYQLRPGQRHLQMANVTFDVFVGDLARALCSGGTLVLCPRDLLLAPDQLADLIHREAIAIAEFVPAVLRPLLHYLREANRRLDPLGVLICGSDSWSMQEFEQVRQLCRPETRVINSFGVTEATIDSTWYDATTSARSGDQGVPIGRPFRSTTTYILDPQGQPVPVGVAGELYLGGVSLAR